jgi:hypothetical protein
MRRILMLAALLAVACPLMAQQYKWRDESGRIRYGDVPPPGVEATRLRPPPPPSSSSAAKSLKERDAEFRKRQQEAEKAREKEQQTAEAAAAKREDCARAQEYIRTIESGQRITRTDSRGERYYLDDAQRAQELAKARQAAQQSCD